MGALFLMSEVPVYVERRQHRCTDSRDVPAAVLRPFLGRAAATEHMNSDARHN